MTESTKVSIPKEVAEAIESLRAGERSNWYIMYQSEGAVLDGSKLVIKRWAFDQEGGTPDLLMHALVDGYEIERTPHEVLREYYEDIHADIERNVGLGIYRSEGTAEGVLKTLNILGITVEGING